MNKYKRLLPLLLAILLTQQIKTSETNLFTFCSIGKKQFILMITMLSIFTSQGTNKQEVYKKEANLSDKNNKDKNNNNKKNLLIDILSYIAERDKWNLSKKRLNKYKKRELLLKTMVNKKS